MQIITYLGPNCHVTMLQMEVKLAETVFLSSSSDEQSPQTIDLFHIHLCLCSSQICGLSFTHFYLCDKWLLLRPFNHGGEATAARVHQAD